MTGYPIIFSASMVLALLDGRKTMTRRLALTIHKDGLTGGRPYPSQWQRVKPGDRLWVRENLTRSGGLVQYAADHATMKHQLWAPEWKQDPRPSIHMPRWASRLTLIVTETKIESLQEITHEDAEAEGVQCDMSVRGFRDHFASLWDRLHGNGAWGADPDVVALRFSVHKTNIDQLPKAQAA